MSAGLAAHLADENTPASPQPSSPTGRPDSSTPVTEPAPPHPPSRQRKRLLIRLAVAVLLTAAISSGLGTFISSLSTGHTATKSSPGIVGHASFFSSRQLNHRGVASINDGLQVQLQNIQVPSPGNHYYAWLQDNQVETVSIYLGVLNVNQGAASLSYIDNQHRDLLAIMSSFLITEETANGTPNSPSLDKGQWHYYATLPQTRSPKDNFSYLDHIRHLLSSEPALEHLHLRGGVDYWFLNNIEAMQREAIEVRDHVNLQVVRQGITNMLYYLDGKCAPQDLSNAAGNTLPGNDIIAHDTSIGLLDCPQVPEPPGHLTHIQRHLSGIVQSSGATAEQVKQAVQINQYLNTIRSWLEQVRTDAMQLANMDDAHLHPAYTLRSDMAVQAGYLVSGRMDPTTHTAEPGAQQITNDIELLASFDIKAYKA